MTMVDDYRRCLWSCVCLLVLAANVRWTLSDQLFPQNGPVIIDTDGGIFDAMAILMLLHYQPINVKAITCVRGVTDAINAAMNVQKTLNVVQRYDIALHVGANYGYVYTEPLKNIFGKDGFGDLETNGSLLMTNLVKGHGAVILAKMVSENPGKITVVCLGPLTNLAIACHIQPLFLKLARRVLFLGGTLTGAGTFKPGVEFNIEMDPEAAALVFNRAEAISAPIIVYPMEAVPDSSNYKIMQQQMLESMDSPSAKFLVRLIQATYEGDNLAFRRYMEVGLFESNLVACLMSPHYAMTVDNISVVVETQGVRSRGFFLADDNNVTGLPPNAFAIIQSSRTELRRLINTHLSR